MANSNDILATDQYEPAPAVRAELGGNLDANKIVLVTPPYERIAKGYTFVKHVTNRTPTLGLLHLAAAVREEGIDGFILSRVV